MITLLKARFLLSQVRFSTKTLFQPLPLIILVIKKYLLMCILKLSLHSFKPLLLITSSTENYLLYIYCYSETIYKLPFLNLYCHRCINSASSMFPLIIFFFSNAFIFFVTLCISLLLCCHPNRYHSFAEKTYFLPMSEKNEEERAFFKTLTFSFTNS